MSNFIYKNPISPEQLNGVQSVSRTETFGTNFSVLGVGGFMEVYNISDLYFTIPTGTTGNIELSGNTIPISVLIGTGAPFSPNVLTLNSDNISSGRRRLGMLVYVREVDQVYQYDINDYEIIWSAATGATGVGGDTVVFSDFGTTVKSNTAEGINFISAWTANTVDGVSGVTRANAVWKKYYGSNLSITGGSYNAGTGTLTLTNITGGTQNITGFSGGGGGGGITGGTFIYSAQTLELYSSGGTISITGFSDVFVTGGTYSAGTITFTNNSGTTFDVTGLTTGGVSGEYLPLSGGTVTGGTIFTSGVTANTLSSVDYIDFDLTVTATSAVSRLRYDSGEGGLVTTMFGGNVDLKVGQENVAYCYNGDTITLTKGMVVAIIGNQGNKPRIQRAIASAETTSSTALGIVSETIASGNEGFVTTFGNVRGFQITGITPGSYVYLSPTVLGGFTGTQPQAPDHIVALGYVVRTGNTQGEIFVNISNGWELNELHNVRITNPQNNDILQYSAGTSPVWVNTSSPQLSGLTATTISATTYQNLPQDIFVTGGTYTNGEIIFTNNSGSTFTVTGLPIGGPGGQVYYFNLSNTQTPYQEFSPSTTTSAEQTSGVSVNSGVTTTIASFQTPNGYPNTTLIPAGYWSFYLHSYKENSGASFDIFCEVYLRTTGGTETLLLSTDPAPITSNSPTPSMQLSDGYYSGSSVSESDRIVVKVRATNTGNQTNTVTFFTEGTQHYSYGITPFNNNDILTCETLSGCSIIQTIQSDVSNKVSKSGDTMTGQLNVPTISATTYLNLPTDVFVTGSSYDNANTLTFTNNTGGTFNVSFNTFTGITATTISATTYQNLPSQSGTGVNSLSYSPSTGILTLTKNDSTTLTAGTFTYLTGASYSNNVITLTDNLGSSSVVLINTVTGWTINGDLTVTGTTTSSIISATTYQNLPSFNFAQVDGVTQFSAETNNFINFSGINISITSAATNTLVFSAGTGVTSVSAIAPITSTSGGTPVISTSMSTNRLIGRTTSGSGVMEEISLTTTGTNGNSSLSALTLNVPNYSLNDLGEISISTANAREDDYAPTGWPGTSDRVRVIRIDSTNTNYMMSLGGLASPSAGRIVTIVNNSAANNLIIIENLSTSSLAVNRFRMTANMAYFLLPTRSVTFIYDGNYWTQMSASLNMGLDIFDDCTAAAQNAFTVGGSNSVGLAGCATSGTGAAIRAGGDNFGSFDLSTGTVAAGYAFMSMQARRAGGNNAFAVNGTFPYLVVGRISLTQLGTALQDFQAAIGINGATSVVTAAQAIGYMWYYNGSANAFWDNRSQNTAGTVSTVASPLAATAGVFNILGVYKPGGANIRDAVYFYSTNAVTYSVSSKFVGTAGTYGGNPTFGLISTAGTTAKEIRMDYYGASFNLVR